MVAGIEMMKNGLKTSKFGKWGVIWAANHGFLGKTLVFNILWFNFLSLCYCV